MQGIAGLIPIAVVAGIIGFLIYYFRDYIPIFQKKVVKTDVDSQIEGLLDSIRKLAREHQYNKAGLLVWNTFSVAAEGYLGASRMPAQTARAYGLSMLSHEDISVETVQPIFELFEKARYSKSEVSLQEFNLGLTGLHRFLKIANDISSKTSGAVQAAPDDRTAPAAEEAEAKDDDF